KNRKGYAGTGYLGALKSLNCTARVNTTAYSMPNPTSVGWVGWVREGRVPASRVETRGPLPRSLTPTGAERPVFRCRTPAVRMGPRNKREKSRFITRRYRSQGSSDAIVAKNSYG